MMESPKTFRDWKPDQNAQTPISPEEILPEGDLVFFLIDVVQKLDLSPIYSHYERETRGAPPFDVAMMVTLLVYSYCIGIFSSRKIAAACERNVAFIAIVGKQPPDFRTISDFRKIHLKAFKDLFLQVLRIAGEAGMVKLGNVALDGSKVKANASRHKAMSYGYMKKEVERSHKWEPSGEIDELLEQATSTDAEQDAASGSRRGDELPEELARRRQRLQVIEEAMARLEQEAREKAEAKRQERQQAEAEREARGQTRRGPEPKPIDDTPEDKSQTNFTDPESKIMKTSNKGFDYCYNGQAAVDMDHQIILSEDVTASANDKQQATPMAQETLDNLETAGIETPKDDQGETQIPFTADSGYYSESNVEELESSGFDPYIAVGRQKHNQPHPEGPRDSTDSDSDDSDRPKTAKEKMGAKVRTASGRAIYAQRKHIVEPVFGQIKQARGFRQFLLRGLEKVRGEWTLLCLTHNLLKIWRYQSALT